jgi:hypothetical protein
MRCEEVRKYLPGDGPDAEVPADLADRVAAHVDACAECGGTLEAAVARALGRVEPRFPPRLPDLAARVEGPPARGARAGLAAAAAILVALGAVLWAYLSIRPEPPPVAPAAPPREEPVPEPPALADLPEADRKAVLAESALAQYAHFMATCINGPADEDRRAFLAKALDTLRGMRPAIRARAATETVAVFNEALRSYSAARPATMPHAPVRIRNVSLETQTGGWQVTHDFMGSVFTLGLRHAPPYLNFAYLRRALGTDAEESRRLEEAVWFDLYKRVNVEDLNARDAEFRRLAEEAILPALSPRRQQIYRRLLRPL